MAEPWESWPIAEDAPRQGAEAWRDWPIADEGDSGPMGFLNRPIMGLFEGMSDIARAPARLFANEAAEQALDVGPTEVARRAGVEVARPGEQPDTFLESAARGTGEAAAALIPGGVGVGLVGSATRASAPTVSRALGTVADPFLRRFATTTATELAAGAGAGAGGKLAEDAGAPRWVGEMAGGTAAVGVPYLAGRFTPGAYLARKVFTPFTEGGSWARASERMRKQSGRVEEDIAAIDDPALADLTPAQRTGNPRLLQIEQAVRNQEPGIDERIARSMDQAVESYKRGIREISEGGEGFDAVRFMQQHRQALNDALDEQLMLAEARAAQRLEEVSPQMRETEASTIYREELEKALSATKATENRLWAEVPRDVRVPTTNARAAFKEIQSSLGRAQSDDIPPEAVKLLDPDRNSAFGADESVKEMHALYSKLRETARNARAGETPNRNMARIADDLAEAVMRDMEGGEAEAPLSAALAFTRQRAEKFNQGVVGEILGRRPTGGKAVAPEDTLRRGLGRTGARGAVAADEMARAVGDSSRAQSAAEQYLSRRFVERAVTDGRVDPRKAATFMRDHDEQLDRFPELKQRLQSAIEEGRFAREATETVAKGRKEAETAPSALMAGARRGREFESILQAQDPAAAARVLVREARRDPSGKALRGLKTAATEFLMGRGEDISFSRMRNELADPQKRGALMAILSSEDVGRIQNTIKALDRLKAATKGYGGAVIDDTPNTILDTAARVIGAVGGENLRMGQGGAGASLQAAQIGSSKARTFLRYLTGDRAYKLIVDAQTDPELYKALLASPKRVFRGKNPLRRRLAAWLSAETGQQIDFDDEGEAPERAPGPQSNAGGGTAQATTQTFRPSEENPSRVYSLLTERGVPAHVAAGLVGNIMQESGPEINPLAVGDNGQSGGALQLKGPRWRAFLDWSRENAMDPRALESQVEFMLHELRTSERAAAERIWAARTPAEAARAASKFYWRPGRPHMDKRVQYARQIAAQ